MNFKLKYLFVLIILLISITVKPQDTSSYVVVNKIILIGNKKTKDRIVFRELSFSLNDTINKKDVQSQITESKNNLINTSLFNFVTIKYTITDNKIDFTINLEERWYLWPYPILEHADRNFSSFLHNRDWNRINYGIYFVKYNFRGRREILKIKLRSGYKEQYSLIYSLPFIDKKQKNGIDIQTYYFRQHEISYNTINNQQIFSKLENKYFSENFFQVISYNFRPRFFNTFNLQIGYNNINVNDTIINLNNEYLFNNQTNMQYIFSKISFTKDLRNNKIYPLSGYYYNINLTKKGFGILSNFSMLQLYQDFRIYNKIYNRFYFQTRLAVKNIFLQKIPYYFQNALGYENYLRGYEYYVIDGNRYYLTRTNIKYEIIPTTKKVINIIPFDKFKKIHYALYTNIFFDSGYVNNDINTTTNYMQNQFLYSYGIGFDFVTYYDKVFRIEYSINKFGTKGIFLHLSSSI